MSMKSPSPTRWWNNLIGPWVTLDFYLPLEGLAKWRGFKISPLFCWGGGGGGGRGGQRTRFAKVLFFIPSQNIFSD